MSSYDLIVVGGGPAGYVAAIRAGQLGKKVLCVERDRAGGTCLNWGCIPTKALLRSAELFQLMNKKAGEFGFAFDGLQYDWKKIIDRSRGVADKNAAGIESLFKKYKVEHVKGEATLEAQGRVSVSTGAGERKSYSAAKILLSTGAAARPLPSVPFNGTTVISSKEAMVLPKQPGTMVIIGGGAIGIEFAYFYNAFGTKVTVVEAKPRILPLEDEEVSRALQRSLEKQGITIFTETNVEKVQSTGDSVRVGLAGRPELVADCCLVAIGVQAVLPPGLQPKLTAQRFVEVNERYETNLAGIYAAGDLIGPPLLAHVASFEAIQAVNGMFGVSKPRMVSAFPSCTYCHPQVASVGLTEKACVEKGLKFKVGKFPFSASGKARALGDIEGFIKIIFGEPDGEVLGAHIIGPEATELIGQMTLAMEAEVTYDEIEAMIHAHPTLGEAVHEATGVALGHAIHI